MAQGDLFSSLNANNLAGAAAAGNISQGRQIRDMQQLLQNEMAMLSVKKKILDIDKKGNSLMKDAAKLMKDAAKKHDAYLKNKKQVRDMDKEMEKLQKRLQKELDKRNNANQEMVNLLTEQTQQLEYQRSLARVQNDQMRRALPLGGKLAGVYGRMSKAVKGTGYAMNTIKDIGSGIHGIFDLILTPLRMMGDLLMKPWRTFLEMQSITGNLAADIGLMSSETYKFKDRFADLANGALNFGGTMQDVATAMRVWSEESNRNRMLDRNNIEKLIELGYATGLGVEGATQMVAMYDNMGLSFEKGIELTDKARNVAAKYNLNSTKLLNNLNLFTRSLNGFEFKNGLAGLTQIVAKAESLRYDLGSIGSIAQKLFDPEGAIEASAQLNVLGGRFAAMGDPFGLMYAAQNAPEELAKGLMDMTKGMAKKRKDGSFFITPADRMMIQQAAQAMGENADNLINAALEQGRIADKLSGNSLLKKGIFKEDELEALGNLITVTDGKSFIRMPQGYDKLLSEITSKSEFQAILAERSRNDKAAIERKNWSERFSLILEKFMIGFAQPFVKLEGIFKNKSFFDKVEALGQTIADQLIPFVESIFSSDGKIFNFLQSLTGELADVFQSVQQFFSSRGDQPFLSTLTEGLGSLFGKLIEVVIPYIQYGFGSMFAAMGGIPLIGGSLREMGLEMQYKAARSNSNIAGFTGMNTRQGQSAHEQKMLEAYAANNTGWGSALGYAGAGAGLGFMLGGPAGAAIGGALGLGYAGIRALMEDSPQEQLKKATKVNDGVITSSGQVVKYPKGELLAVMAPHQNTGGSGGGASSLELSGTIRIETPLGTTGITMQDLKNAGIHVIANALAHEKEKSDKGYGLNDSKDIRTTLAI